MRRSGIAGLAGLGLGLAAGAATAGGFQLREGSAAAQGASLAGRASLARDVSFALGNPAALKAVQGVEVTSGIAPVVLDFDATYEGALTGFDRTDTPGTLGFVPSFAAGWRVTPEVVIGLTVDSPFGLATEYSSGFAGAFDAIDSELLTAAVTPMVAWSPLPELTVGAGLSIQYARGRLTNLTASLQEGELSGDDIGIGVILGVLAEPVPGTRLGLRYRSGVSHTLSGDFSGSYTVPGAGVLDGPGTASVDLPASVNFGITQEIGRRFRVMAEAEFIDWSVYDAVRVTSSVAGPLPADVQNYRDSWMGAVGAEYDWSDALTLRAGVAYDQTPLRKELMTTRLPDSDKVWLSVGFSWDITQTFGVDAAYTYLIFTDDPVATLRNPPAAGETVRYDNAGHSLGLNARFRF